MHARTQIYPLLTSSIQYKAPLCSCSPIFRGEVFDNVFPINCCISSVGQFSTKGESIQFSRCPPLAWITLWKYHSQSHTSIVPALKNKLLNSLLTFSSVKVLLCRQTKVCFRTPCNVFAAKTTMSQQHLRWLWRNLCVHCSRMHLLRF